MNTAKTKWSVAFTLAAVMAATGCQGEATDCRTEGDLEICGQIGEHLYSTAVAGTGDVQWPPIATPDGRLFLARGNAIAEVSKSGQSKEVARFGGTLSVLSQSPDGSLIATETNGETHAISWSGKIGPDGKPATNWNTSVGGSPSAVPVAIGGGMLAASARTPSGHTEKITVLSPKDGKQRKTIMDATRPVVMDNGSIRALRGERPCGSHESLIALTADGEQLWTYTETEHRGIVDYSPGPGAVVYIVTEERALRAIGPAGTVKWSFEADCPDCTIAGAPTVTHDRLYFPVWEGGEWACQQNRWEAAWGTDPLYSLHFDGTVEWVYDGFHTKRTVFQPAGIVPLSPQGGTVAVEDIQHHPAGRPTVANDGTLYVDADGAMVALDRNGAELGRVIMDRRLGEKHKKTGTANVGTEETYDGGTQATPVLAADGRLYAFDGEKIMAFSTGKTVASVPWLAPFGGATNASSVQ